MQEAHLKPREAEPSRRGLQRTKGPHQLGLWRPGRQVKPAAPKKMRSHRPCVPFALLSGAFGLFQFGGERGVFRFG